MPGLTPVNTHVKACDLAHLPSASSSESPSNWTSPAKPFTPSTRATAYINSSPPVQTKAVYVTITHEGVVPVTANVVAISGTGIKTADVVVTEVSAPIYLTLLMLHGPFNTASGS